MRTLLRQLLVTICVTVSLAWGASSVAFAAPLVDGLATSDRHGLALAVEAIERAPATTPELSSALFAAARACEDRLADPVRALALYTRIARDFPHAGAAIAAARRADQLRAEIGTGTAEATAFAQLVARADQLSVEDVSRRAEALATASWPGAADAALWLAEYLRRLRHFAQADARYADVIAHWSGSKQSSGAARGRAGNALDVGDWDRAVTLATALPTDNATDTAVRTDILRAAGRGAARAKRYVGSWIALGLVALILVGSLVQALWQNGWHRQLWRPPIEVLYLGPIGVVFVAAAFTAHKAIAPAVLRIMTTGIALAWLSGATLELLRTNGRPLRARSIAHIVACTIGVVAIAYIAMTRDGLLDMLIETVRFGPEAT